MDVARKRGESFKGVVNEVLRQGLKSEDLPPAVLPRFVVHAKDLGFRSGVDELRLNELSDEIEISNFKRKLASGQ
jgi:hypothetical protein